MKWDDVRAADNITRKSLHFSGLAQAKRFLAKRQLSNHEDNNVNSGVSVKYRTATSNQSSDVDWVQPGKDIDITTLLLDINNKLEDEIDIIVKEVIREYEGLI